MKVTSADFDMLIPYYRQTAMYCLAGAVALVIIGAVIAVGGMTLSVEPLVQYGGDVLCATSLAPFKLFYERLEKVKLLTRVRSVSAQGGEIPEATNEVVMHMLMGT